MQLPLENGFNAINNMLAYFNVFKTYYYNNYSAEKYNIAKYLKEIGKKFCIKLLDETNNIVSGAVFDLSFVKTSVAEIREIATSLSDKTNPALIKNTNINLDRIEELALFLATPQFRQVISNPEELKEIRDKIYFLRYDRCILL